MLGICKICFLGTFPYLSAILWSTLFKHVSTEMCLLGWRGVICPLTLLNTNKEVSVIGGVCLFAK